MKLVLGRSWCCLCGRSVQTWYLSCEAAAEETLALAVANEKPKEGKVAGQDGSVEQFKIKRHTPLSKLMKCLSMRQIRFRFDGQPINETDTPAQLMLEDEDTIDVFQQQTGGSVLTAQSLKPALDFRFCVALSLCSSPAHTLSLSQE
uniref:Ubiquitin-like domain-containing protein n=1 Tax=Panthera tigris altaica TaxID=74533 RepID=A0A8C9J7T5_PANTA